VPLLWIIPLTLYLVSWILVFLRWPAPWVGVGRNPRNTTPHKVMVVTQLAGIALLILVIMTNAYSPPVRAMLICWGAFLLTALVCHGELARDRPPTKFLTEFYLWIAVGGMVGGTFNALIAPLVPWFGLFEFPLAIVFAALVRPGQKAECWTDSLLGAYQSPNGASISIALDLTLPLLVLFLSYFLISHAIPGESWGLSSAGLANPSDYPRELDAVVSENMNHPLFRFAYRTVGMSAQLAYWFACIMFLLIAYGIGMACALLAWKRPLRMALGLGAVLLASGMYERNADRRHDYRGRITEENVLYRDRSYFGILRVMEQKLAFRSDDGKGETPTMRATYLLHGTTHHGLNYQFPDGTGKNILDPKLPAPNMLRVATTYYHADGPVGMVMERLNWFPGYKTDTEDKRVTYWADARLPA
jgi:hypothetical protein